MNRLNPQAVLPTIWAMGTPSVPSRTPGATATAGEVAVARQPVADRRLRTVGYELLLGRRPAAAGCATAALLADALGEIGLPALVGDRPAWLPCTREFLLSEDAPPVAPERVVLLVPAAPADDELLAALDRLRELGFRLALDGWDGDPALAPLLAACSTVRVDVERVGVDGLPGLVAAARAPGRALAAVRIPGPDEFDACLELGFGLFQGPFFAKPRAVAARHAPSARLGALRSLARLRAPGVGFDELERIIADDVGLSLRLLRYANSAFFGLPRDVASVREALILLGERNVRRWATVLTLAAATDKPHELVVLALVRARTCEGLAPARAGGERESLFTVGLFSVVDALLDVPMTAALADLPFTAEVRAALEHRAGPKGAVLARVLAHERGDFVPGGDWQVAAAYRAAIAWADGVGSLLA